MQLVRPTRAHLPGYVAALERGWSPSHSRGAAEAHEALARIAQDTDGFLALMDDAQARGPAVTLPDGTLRPRIPGLQRWIWDDAAGDPGFAGSIGLRWMKDGAPLPPHVLGHIGYAVVPWKQRRGLATRALALMLPIARAQGLHEVEITTDPDNRASQRVITANGGVLVETFDKGEPYGHQRGLRFRIELARATLPGPGLTPA
ncbi:MAG: GNAT family N-acetyltransferase [Burkholderiales bacterium]|nr:GNAT family N-acetyltransferase [Burkholderiales bacterium]MDE2276882.1 GNAT family N-acetyltransferase [Burkholderiales bacterium]